MPRDFENVARLYGEQREQMENDATLFVVSSAGACTGPHVDSHGACTLLFQYSGKKVR